MTRCGAPNAVESYVVRFSGRSGFGFNAWLGAGRFAAGTVKFVDDVEHVVSCDAASPTCAQDACQLKPVFFYQAANNRRQEATVIGDALGVTSLCTLI